VHEVESYGFFVLSRYHDVVTAAQDWENFSTTWGPGPQRIENPVASILQSDPPQHAASLDRLEGVHTARRSSL